MSTRLRDHVTTRDPSHDPAEPVAHFLAQYAPADRAEALHLALRALRARVEPDRVLACELAWEVHTHGYWRQLRQPDGRPYETEEQYFRDVLGVASWRTAYKRLAIGRMLMGFEARERAHLRAAIAAIGLAKATIVAPAIERCREWRAGRRPRDPQFSPRKKNPPRRRERVSGPSLPTWANAERCRCQTAHNGLGWASAPRPAVASKRAAPGPSGARRPRVMSGPR